MGPLVRGLMLAIRGIVDSLDLVMLDPGSDRPVVEEEVGLAVAPFHPRAWRRNLRCPLDTQ
jgi:hypothetical protein